MKVFTSTSYNEHYNLYTETDGLIAINSYEVGVAKTDIILLSKPSLIVYKAGKQAGVTNTEFIKFTLSNGLNSIDDFNAKIKIAIFQQRQGWQPPQIKDVKLFTPKDLWLIMRFLMLLVYKTNTLKRPRSSDQPCPLALTKHHLIHHLLQRFSH